MKFYFLYTHDDQMLIHFFKLGNSKIYLILTYTLYVVFTLIYTESYITMLFGGKSNASFLCLKRPRSEFQRKSKNKKHSWILRKIRNSTLDSNVPWFDSSWVFLDSIFLEATFNSLPVADNVVSKKWTLVSKKMQRVSY